jgi:arsenate reductase (thioredoxin)
MAKKPRVLFLCTGNSARSQMAEAFLRKHAGDRFEVHSAGLEPKGIHPLTVQVMEEVGIPLDGHRSKSLQEYFMKVQIGYLITVCSSAEEKCPTLPGVSKRLHWAFEDPAAYEGAEDEKLAKFREVRDQIDGRIQDWLRQPDLEAG